MGLARSFLVAGCLVGSGTAASAQAIPSSLFTPPPSIVSRPAGPLVELPTSMGPEEAAKVLLRISGIVIEGSTVYSLDDFRPLYENLIRQTVTAAAVYELAARIGAKYGNDGYLVARAVVVPQAVNAKAATIRIRVIEGYIERIEWPEAASRYRDFFTACLEQLKHERPARTKTLERCLLLASDLPGLKFTSALKAGKDPKGGIILVVALTEKPIDATARLDNRGIPGRGPWEWLASVTENNRLAMNESLNFTYGTAFDPSELHYYSTTYHQALLPGGLYFDANAYQTLGTPNLPATAPINYRTNSDGIEAGLTDPLIRTREQNLFVSARFFVENAYSDALGAPLTDDRLRGFRLRANYDQVDTWLGTVAQTQIITTFSQGINGLGGTSNDNPLASVAGGLVNFSKLEVLANRTQALAYGFSLYGAAYAQWAGSTLLVPEECGYGGQYFGRAFDPFALAGDNCWEMLGELRFDPAIRNNLFSETQLYGFFDHGDVARLSPAVGTPADLTGASAGAGLRLAWKRNPADGADTFSLDVQGARQIEGETVDAWRGFLILTAHY